MRPIQNIYRLNFVSAASVPSVIQVNFRIEFDWLLKTTKSKFYVNNSASDWSKNLGWPRLNSLHCRYFFLKKREKKTEKQRNLNEIKGELN